MPDSQPDLSDSSSTRKWRVVEKVHLVDNETLSFKFWSIVFTDEKDYFHHRWPSLKLPDDMSEIFAKAQPIPHQYYMVPPPPDLTAAPSPLPDDSYVKLYSLLLFDPETPDRTDVTDAMIQEAKVFERLLLNPHPDICEYRGYVKTGELMSGLCLKRYPKQLQQAIRNGDAVDAVAIIDGIRSGLDHLHTLNFVHNDINPTNIMLNSSSQPIIIDFDSCGEIGTRIDGKRGTPPWTQDFETSEKENDLYGLERIRDWLAENAMTHKRHTKTSISTTHV